MDPLKYLVINPIFIKMDTIRKKIDCSKDECRHNYKDECRHNYKDECRRNYKDECQRKYELTLVKIREKILFLKSIRDTLS